MMAASNEVKAMQWTIFSTQS